jgi:hypothetical protein
MSYLAEPTHRAGIFLALSTNEVCRASLQNELKPDNEARWNRMLGGVTSMHAFQVGPESSGRPLSSMRLYLEVN